MKTTNFLIAALFAFVFLSSSILASETTKSKSEEVSRFSAKVQNEIFKNLEMHREMNNTKAEALFNVDSEGKTTFLRVKYPDKEKALQMTDLISSLKLDNLPIKKGIYSIDILFVVR